MTSQEIGGGGDGGGGNGDGRHSCLPSASSCSGSVQKENQGRAYQELDNKATRHGTLTAPMRRAPFTPLPRFSFLGTLKPNKKL